MANSNLAPASAHLSIYESRPVEASAAATQTLKPKGAKVAPLPAALVALFLFAQLFDYHALRLSTFTPDKILFFLLLLLFTHAASTGRLRSISSLAARICSVSPIAACKTGGSSAVA